MPVRTARLLALALLALPALPGCGDGGDGRGPYIADQPDEIAFEAAWKPATRFVAAAEDRLIDADPAAGAYTFAGEVGDLATLAAGDVAVLEGVGLLRVDSVTASGDQVVVQGEPAALADAIQDGTMSWDVGFDFTRPERFLAFQVGESAPLLLVPERPSFRVGSTTPAGSVSWTGTISGFNVSLKLTPAGEDVAIAFTAKYASGNASASVKGAGTLRGFRVQGSAEVAGGSLASFRVVTEGIEADLTLEFGGVELGTKNGAFSVPAKMILPFTLGPIPAWASLGGVLEISSTLKTNTSALAKAHLVFQGAVGMRGDGSGLAGLVPLARVDRIDLEHQSSESVATLTSGLGVLMQFPRFEIGLGLPGTGAEAYATVKNEVVANTTVNYDAAGPFPVVTGTCLEVSVNLGAYVGGALKAFNFTVASAETPVAAKLMPTRKTGDCK